MKNINWILVAFFIIYSVTTSWGQTKKYDKQRTKAFIAIANNDQATLTDLFQKGMSVDVRNERKETLLMVACYKNNIEMEKFLIDAGANVNAQDDAKNSPFLYSVSNGKLDLAQIYINKGVNYYVVDREGDNALLLAAKAGDANMTALLLKDKKLPINMVNNDGWSAVIEAIVMGDGSPKYVTVIEQLIAAKIDLNIADNKNGTALEYATTLGYGKIANIIREAGGKISSERGDFILIME